MTNLIIFLDKKKSSIQPGISQQDEAKSNCTKPPTTNHLRDLFISLDKGRAILCCKLTKSYITNTHFELILRQTNENLEDGKGLAVKVTIWKELVIAMLGYRHVSKLITSCQLIHCYANNVSNLSIM